MHTISCSLIAVILRAFIAVIAVFELPFAYAVVTCIVDGAEIAVVTGSVVRYGSIFTTRCRIAGVCCARVVVVADLGCVDAGPCRLIAGIGGAGVVVIAALRPA
jgi:hypothetical protein